MVELVKRYKILCFIGCILIINFVWYIYQNHSMPSIDLNLLTVQEAVVEERPFEPQIELSKDLEVSNNEIIDSATEQISTQSVPIYICGEVKNPGVYYVDTTAIINDVVILCGGLTEEADPTLINLASTIIPNEMIKIPKQGELIEDTSNVYNITGTRMTVDMATSSSNDTATSQLININSASVSDLMNLPGIGSVKAEAIVSYREVNKFFTSIEEIKNVSGIGEKTFEKLKDLITI